MSDAELKQSLQDFGVSCGPLTNTTRGVYAKKLSKLIAKAPASEPEVVQTRQTVSHEDLSSYESTENTITTRSSQRFQKVVGIVDDVDSRSIASSSNIRDVFSTPRSYTPDGSNLTRRPLSTPHRPAAKVDRIQSTTTTSTYSSSGVTKGSASKGRGIISYCRYILPVLVVLILLLFLVYYHMEEGMFKELTG